MAVFIPTMRPSSATIVPESELWTGPNKSWQGRTQCGPSKTRRVACIIVPLAPTKRRWTRRASSKTLEKTEKVVPGERQTHGGVEWSSAQKLQRTRISLRNEERKKIKEQEKKRKYTETHTEESESRHFSSALLVIITCATMCLWTNVFGIQQMVDRVTQTSDE